VNQKNARAARKLPLFLVSPAGIAMEAHAAKGGADKYGAYNFRDGDVSASVYIGSVLRHVLAYACGEDVDPDPSANGATHIGGARAGLGILADATVHGNLLDDRAKSPRIAALFRQLLELVEKPKRPRKRRRA